MYQITLESGKTVGYYIDELPLARKMKQSYISVTIPAEDLASAEELHRRGFSFTERNILLEVPLKGICSSVKMGPKYNISIFCDWTADEIYSIAKEGF